MELWSRVAARGWDVRVLTGNTDAAAPRETVRGMEIVRLPVWQFVDSRLPALIPGGDLVRAWRDLRRWHPDVVVTNTRFFSTSIMGMLAGARMKAPTLHIDHGSRHIEVGSRLGNLVSEAIDHTVGWWVLRRATVAVGVSGAVSEFLAHLGRDGAGVLHNGVDCAAFAEVDGAAVRRELEIPADAVVILFAGRLIADKGIGTLIEAFASLGNTANLRLVVAGDGPEMATVRAAAQRDPRIRALGFVSSERMPALLAAADVFAHPSAYPEGLPTSVLEAGAASKAVVATPAGGTGEAVIDGSTGIMVPMRDPNALARALDMLVNRPERRRELGRAARQHVVGTFDWERIADRAVALLDELARRQAASPRTSHHRPERP